MTDLITVDVLQERFGQGEELTDEQMQFVRDCTGISHYYSLVDRRSAVVNARREYHAQFRAQLRMRGDYQRSRKEMPLHNV